MPNEPAPHSEFEVDAYLRRIGYSGPVEPTVDTLVALHRAHLVSVPFENLDIHLGRPIELGVGRFYAKIVGEGRGGFCYELNGAFAELLRRLGFLVTLHSAQVWGGDRFGPDHDHLCLRVQLDEPWLVDVGFGDCFLSPISLDEALLGVEQLRESADYRWKREDGWLVLEERKWNAEWWTCYRVSLRPEPLADFRTQCLYFQQSPDSHFRKKLIVTRATPDGRVTLADRKLTVSRYLVGQGAARERVVERVETELDDAGYEVAMDSWFGPAFNRIAPALLAARPLATSGVASA